MATSFDADAIKTSADKLGSIMDDMSAFDDLKNHWPNAGNFNTAQWIERIVDDRRNAIVEHGERLKKVLGDLKVGLHQVADDFTDADGDNATKIQSDFDATESTISSDISSMDQGTEAEQHNVSDDPNGPKNNDTDGDGYNDVLPTPAS